ncbi:hypothetical protein BDZ91DRAFT_761432 [Kalaharituber pfeilii]|nr:hypothetical protein BDZ91DRAFT_761432 [Kalaharituber pfeilii]
MRQYSRRAGDVGNSGKNERYTSESEEYAPITRDRENRIQNIGLGIKDRLPLNPRPVLPRGNTNQQPLQSSSNQSKSQSKKRDSQLNDYEQFNNSGRSLTNPQGGRTAPLRPTYTPPEIGSLQEEEPGIAYGGDRPAPRSQPRYNRPVDYDEDFGSPSLMVSPTIGVNSPRSILIGFDDSPPPVSNGSIPLAPITPSQQSRRFANNPSLSSRRGTSSYYSQPAMVSPIPEESPSPRHGSYASSYVIPSAWGTVSQSSPSVNGDGDDEGRYRRKPSDEDDQPGLVRQASVGKKSKPILTDIRSPSQQESIKESFLNTDSESPGPSENMAPKNLQVAKGSLPTTSGSIGASPTESTQEKSALAAFSFPAPGGNVNFGAVRKEAETSSGSGLTIDSVPHSRNSSIHSSVDPLSATRPAQFSTNSRMKGRKVPPGLNLNAVRDAEARGSLTSLPDLIRRATKLAAVLESGRTNSSWGSRGSYTASFLTNTSDNRRTDSISDILASFPPPVPGAGGTMRGGFNGSRTLSSWPLPSDFQDTEQASLKVEQKKGRKVCGLPLWAFILLVILALLVIAAAVTVPLQLVTLSRGQENSSSDSSTEILRQCRVKNPCQNGGENIATKDFCGCICTGGFGGKTCSDPPPLDNSCVTMDLQEFKRFENTFDVIQNATVGSAIKRLLEISVDQYNVELDASRLLSAFWAVDVSCTAQNALVTFNGKTVPEGASLDDIDANAQQTGAGVVPIISSTPTPTPQPVHKRQLEKQGSEGGDLVYDTSLVPSKTEDANRDIPTPTVQPIVTPLPSSSRTPALDEDAVDFSRVVVLFLVQEKGLNVAVDAQENLQATFTAGVDYGTVDVGSEVIVDLDNRVLQLPGGISVGGPKAA